MSRRFYKAVKPGWKMTEEQASSFWRMWGEVLACQGWDRLSSKDKDARRHEVLEGLGFASIKDVKKGADFDRLKARLLELKGTVVVAGEGEGDRRRVLHRVGVMIAEMEAAEFPDHYLAAIFRNFNMVEGWRNLTDLSRENLVKLSAVLEERLKTWRAQKAAAMARDAMGVPFKVEEEALF